jgi:hypothetical protein
MASQTILTKTLLNFKDILQEGQGLIDTDYVKGVLNRCRCNIIQEEKIVRLLIEWQNLIHKNKSTTDQDKLQKVNQFF